MTIARQENMVSDNRRHSTSSMARKRKATKATKTEGPWDFLLPWFKVLANRLSIAEDRLDTSFLEPGRDPKTDWWISVRWDERGDDPKTLKQLREALVLTSTFADVDYDAWMSNLQQTCGLKAPESINLETKLLRPRFQSDFEPGDEIGYRDIFKDDQAFLVDWKGYAQPMLSFERPSAKFKRELERANGVTLKVKVQVAKPRLRLSVLAPTRVKIERCVDFPNSLHETLANVKELSAGAVGFDLDSIELHMEEILNHVATISILQDILMLNIPINKFSVPKRDEEESPDPFVCSCVWSSFVRTAPVHTLCVPMSLDLDDFAALCSALAEARTVKYLQVYLRDDWRSIFDIMGKKTLTMKMLMRVKNLVTATVDRIMRLKTMQQTMQ